MASVTLSAWYWTAFNMYSKNIELWPSKILELEGRKKKWLHTKLNYKERIYTGKCAFIHTHIIWTHVCSYRHMCLCTNTRVSVQTHMYPYRHTCVHTETRVSIQTHVCPYGQTCHSSNMSLQNSTHEIERRGAGGTPIPKGGVLVYQCMVIHVFFTPLKYHPCNFHCKVPH